MTTAQTLCYNCFQQVTDPSVPCPYCGFDLGENQQKFPVALRAGTALNDRYIVGRVLGQGGFGITYVAFDTQLQARVAIKEYMPSDMATRVEGTTVSVMMDTRAEDFTYGAERFQEEARTLAKFIGHPNIAGVSSYFDENDTSYFVMDYIEGVSFKSYIANNGGKVSVDETLNVMIPVLRALTAVHAEGFIHRDVTPDNIYISKDGNVKLLDFGSARYSIGDKSKSLDVILKVGYAPKEQYIRRGRQGPYTDVYSCAACFYAALTGYLPPESLERLDQDTLVPVSQVLPEIPEWLDKAILKGLAVQPEDRFQSAAEFLDAIENQLVVEVPAAGQTAPAQPAKKKLSPLIIGGIAAAVVAAVGLGAVLGGGTSPYSGAPGTGGGGGVLGAVTGQNNGLPPLKKAEVPYIVILGQEYSTDLREMSLNAPNLRDEDILDLRYMVNLTHLTLGGKITDLRPLEGLTELRSLQLNECRDLQDLSPLAGLTNLVQLSAGVRSVDDFSFLSNLTNLRVLSIVAENLEHLENLDELAGLTELLSLGITQHHNWNRTPATSLTDISALSGLTKLTTLALEVEEGIDLSPLQNIEGLTRLQLQGYIYLKDCTAFSDLTELRDLSIQSSLNESIESLTGLETLTNLSSLHLSMGIAEKIDVLDTTPLTSLTHLTSLTLPSCYSMYTRLDLSGLSNMGRLQQLLTSGRVVSLEPLRGMTELRDATLINAGSYDDPIQSLEVFSELKHLNSLLINATASGVDLSPVAHVRNLQVK